MPTPSNGDGAPEVNAQSKPSFLRRVRIRGYKSIAFCDMTLEPLTILVGRNASGKSNFLDALAFLRDAMKTSVSEAVDRRGGWSSVASRGSNTQSIEFEIEVDFLPDHSQVATYRLELSLANNVAPLIARESLEITDQATQFTPSFLVRNGNIQDWKSKPESPGLVDIPNPRHLFSLYRDRLFLSVLGTSPFDDLGAGLRRMVFYNFIPDTIRPVQKPTSGQLLDRTGGNLAAVIEATRQSDPWAVDRIARYLSVITESVELLGVAKYSDYKTLRFRVTGNGIGQPLEFDAASMSDGTLRVAASLVAAFQIVPPHGSPTLVGIEEPETSLHPAAMRALVDALDEAAGHTQVLLTTHSTELLDNPHIRPESVRVVDMIGGQTVIAPVDEASLEIVRQKLDTLGGLERQNQLGPDADDLERQERLSRTGSAAS